LHHTLWICSCTDNLLTCTSRYLFSYHPIIETTYIYPMLWSLLQYSKLCVATFSSCLRLNWNIWLEKDKTHTVHLNSPSVQDQENYEVYPQPHENVGTEEIQVWEMGRLSKFKAFCKYRPLQYSTVLITHTKKKKKHLCLPV